MTEPQTLPVRPLPTDEVTIDGQTITVRGLSRAAALKLTTGFTKETADDAEVFILVQGTGVTEEHAREWRASVDATTAGLVIDRIIELSALGDLENRDAPDPKA